MRWIDRFTMKIRMLFRRGDADSRLNDELRFHLDRQIEENLAAGMSAEEAQAAALRAFGNPALLRDQTRTAWSWNALESLIWDLRLSLRTLRRAPGFALVASLTLALGIGANTAIFLLTYSLLLKSLPVPHPEELIRYNFHNGEKEIQISYAQYEALRAHQSVTSGLFAWWGYDRIPIREHDRSVQATVAMATGSVFNVLDLRPYLGRGFDALAGERGQAQPLEAVITYAFWRSHFNGDPGVVGQAIHIAKTDVTIVGVLRPGFEGITPENPIDIVLPLSFVRVMYPKDAMIDQLGAFWLSVMGRLKPGQSLASARAALAAADALIRNDADPQHKVLKDTLFGGGYALGVEPGRTGHSWLRRQYSKPLVALEALCALMMLLCAVNTALLVLSRVSERTREFALRCALGAARRRLVAQVLIETLLVGFGGLFLGGLLGWEMARALVALITPVGDPAVLNLRAGAAIVLFAVALSVGAAMLAGLWPAWRASRTSPALELKQLPGQSRISRAGMWIVPAQVALGVVLIYSAFLMIGTLRNYLQENSGFDPHGVTFAELSFPSDDPADPIQVQKSFQIVDAVEHEPGIQSATLLSMPPIRSWSQTSDYFTRDRGGNLLHNDAVWEEGVTEDYFATMGTAILEGRGFARSDVSGDLVCVLSRSAANFFFPGQDPIGRSIGEGDGAPPKPAVGAGSADAPRTFRIIGIAEDARMKSLLEPAPFELYQLTAQEKHPFVNSFLAVRSGSNTLAAAAIRPVVSRILSGADPPKLYTFDQSVNDDLSRQRLVGSVSGGFALLAMALVATGLYGILARTVTEQRREIGIRMALGARRDRIVAGLARRAAARVGLGVIAGAGLASIAERMMRSLLYGVLAQSPSIVLATLGVLFIVLVVAFVVPAGRAASIDPMQTLRME